MARRWLAVGPSQRPTVKSLTPMCCNCFRFELYLLWWQPPHRTHNIAVHGELFTSQAFIEAHQNLQDSPPEANCSLPRRIVTLMFWSHTTQLTSFGEAKLWLLYVYFGNESKYNHTQPMSHLCAHAAYFQMVSVFLESQCMSRWFFCNPATRQFSGFCDGTCRGW